MAAAAAAARKSSKRVIPIEIISDIVCPWCYVGKRNLESALAQVQDPTVEFRIQWIPFQLNPTITKSVNKKAAYATKFGPHFLQSAMAQRLQSVGASLGINFNYEGNIGPVLDAHRLCDHAWEQGVQNELMEVLFRKYFEEAQDPSDHKVLLAAAEEVGVTGAKELLEGAGHRDSVLAAFQKNRRVGGVPFFRIGKEKLEISGAQPPEMFLAAFEELDVDLSSSRD